jgi:mannose-1-phosphate guanylyltransferase
VRAFLLAAGLGTRLKPLTARVPKCLVPVCGRSLLGYWLDLLVAHGVDDILVNSFYLAQQVHEFVAASAHRDRVELLPEPRLFGTGGTLLRHRARLQSGPFLVAHADNLAHFDVTQFRRAHEQRPHGTEITMLTFETDQPSSCGIVELDARGVVIGFHEKVANPPGRLANAAVYIMQPSVLEFLASLNQQEIDLSTQVLPHYVGRIYTHPLHGYLRDIGTPHALAAAEREFAVYLGQQTCLQS